MYKAYLADNPAETNVEKTKEHVKRLEGGGGPPAPEKVDHPGGGGSPAKTPTAPDVDEGPVTHTGVEGAQDWADRAWKYIDKKEWEKARHAFAEAYKLYPVTTFLYNEATCLENLGRFSEAIAMYEAYLGANPAETDVEKTREHLKKLKEAHGGAGGESQKIGEPGGGGAPATPAPAGKAPAEEPITETGRGGRLEVVRPCAGGLPRQGLQEGARRVPEGLPPVPAAGVPLQRRGVAPPGRRFRRGDRDVRPLPRRDAGCSRRGEGEEGDREAEAEADARRGARRRQGRRIRRSPRRGRTARASGSSARRRPISPRTTRRPTTGSCTPTTCCRGPSSSTTRPRRSSWAATWTRRLRCTTATSPSSPARPMPRR